MGHKLTDGKSEMVAAPGGEVINDGDLYRIGGLNGFAVVGDSRSEGHITATDADRNFALVMDTNEVWKVKASSGVISANPAVGDLLYWTTNDSSTFQKGDTHLRATPAAPGEAPCAFVVRRKNAAGYIGVRVLNGVVVGLS